MSRGPLNVVALVRSPELEVELRTAFEGLADARLELRALDSLCEAAGSGFKPAADLVVADLAADDEAERDGLRQLIQELTPRGSAVIAVASGLAPAVMRRLLKEGAADVLARPLDPGEFREALEHVALRRGVAAAAGGSAEGRVLAFSRASGGAGATTLAVNAAHLLGQPRRREKPARVCLIDLDLQFGAAALHLDVAPKMAIFEMAQAPERLDAELFRNSLLQHRSGLKILTAPSTPIPLEALAPDTVSQILGFARAEFDVVVVDLPIALTSWTERVLTGADVLFLASQLNVAAVRQLRRLLEVLEDEGLYSLPVKVVLNRHKGGLWSNRGVKVRQAEKALKHTIDAILPDEPDVVLDAANRGRSVFEVKPRSKFARGLRTLIETSLGQLQTKPQSSAA